MQSEQGRARGPRVVILMSTPVAFETHVELCGECRSHLNVFVGNPLGSLIMQFQLWVSSDEVRQTLEGILDGRLLPDTCLLVERHAYGGEIVVDAMRSQPNLLNELQVKLAADLGRVQQDPYFIEQRDIQRRVQGFEQALDRT